MKPRPSEEAYTEKLERLSRETERFEDVLFEDVTAARQALSASDSDFNRRIFVRVLCSAIEGVTFRLKLHVATFGIYDALDLNDDDLGYLLERLPPSRSGRSSRHRMVRLDRNFAYAISMYTLLHWPSYILNGADTGWTALRNLVLLRNRISHPKAAEDLYVSDLDLAIAKSAERWFLQILGDIYKGCAKRLLRRWREYRRIAREKFPGFQELCR
jgi:hypothetical protein